MSPLSAQLVQWKLTRLCNEPLRSSCLSMSLELIKSLEVIQIISKSSKLRYRVFLEESTAFLLMKCSHFVSLFLHLGKTPPSNSFHSLWYGPPWINGAVWAGSPLLLQWLAEGDTSSSFQTPVIVVLIRGNVKVLGLRKKQLMDIYKHKGQSTLCSCCPLKQTSGKVAELISKKDLPPPSSY